MNKPKFNPIVTRVKLNPEQAVLACSCYNANLYNSVANNRTSLRTVCVRSSCSYVCNVTRNAATAART